MPKSYWARGNLKLTYYTVAQIADKGNVGYDRKVQEQIVYRAVQVPTMSTWASGLDRGAMEEHSLV